MSNLLINEPPLMVLPSLAVTIGLNESIVLQQIHYWLNPRINKTIKDHHHWVYNSYDQWKEQFPFWSAITIKRTFQSLEKMGLLITKNFNASGFNKTKWYRIDYKKLEDYARDASNGSERSARSDQNDPSMGSSCTQERIKMIPSYRDTETTTETSSPSQVSSLKPMASHPKKKEEAQKGKGKTEDMIPENMLALWQHVVGKGEGDLLHRPARKASLLTAFERYFQGSLTEWETYCQKLTTSQFLMGETREKFRLNIDWAIKPDTIEKILDGSIVLGNREQPHSGDHFLEDARRRYNTLSEDELDTYKDAYVKEHAKKEPGFSRQHLDDNPMFYSSRLQHFILTELIKILAREAPLAAMVEGEGGP